MIAKKLLHQTIIISGLALTIFCFLLNSPAMAVWNCDTISVRVNQGSDDAEEVVSSGVMDLTSTDLELIRDGADQTVGMRFQNLTVPPGATITSAYIEFETDETSNIDPSNLTIYGQADDNPSAFTTVAGNISSRTTTSASVSWSPETWSTLDVKHQTGNLSSIVQEIIDRGGWSSGNAMVFIVEGTGRRVAESYDGESTAAPLLVIEYCEGAPPNIVSFQQGINGYSSTIDTYIEEISSTADNSAASTLIVDRRLNDTNNNQGQILLRFDDIFGTGSGQIPPNSTIYSATLEINVTNASDAGALLHRMLQTWNATDNWDTWTNGIDANDIEAASAADSSSGGSLVGLATIDVTQDLQTWSNNTAGNYGWAWLPPSTDDSWQFDSAEGGTPPKLVVSYFDPPTSPPAAPTSLSAISPLSYLSVQLTWTDNADNEGNFEIERSTSGIGGPYTLLAMVGDNTQEYLDTDVVPETEYCYRVRATNTYNIFSASNYTNNDCATTTAEPNNAVDFGGTDAYVSFGKAPELGLPVFTIECWFRRDGTGTAANTGTGGAYAIPLVTKGVGEAENSNVDMNYFLGIHRDNNILFADFESYIGGVGFSPGQNFPVLGTTTIPVDDSTWHHAAATYDGSCWQLYLDGVPETDGLNCPGVPPRYDSIQHAGLAVALNSSGSASGHFDGPIDEARIWNTARTQAEIQSLINKQLKVAQPGLVARWGLNEGIGTTVNDSMATPVNGTLMGTGYSWVPGAPFDKAVNNAPNVPTLISPADGNFNVSSSPNLQVSVSDPESAAMTVTYLGREKGDFTIVALPDTQFYSQSYPNIFIDQTQWIVDNRGSLNIAFVTHLGDVVQNGDNVGDSIEWERADAAMRLLEDPATTLLALGIPFGVAVGNHDQGDASGNNIFFNQFFGVNRFTGGTDSSGLMTQMLPGIYRNYYGGHYGSDNDNHYELFSAGGMDFIIIHLEYDTSPDAAVITWSDGLLAAYPSRRAIVVTHYLMETGNGGAFSTQGQAIWNELKDRPNLFLMLGGHVSGEGRRTDTGTNGNTVYSLLADYQSLSNGGNGWLRILDFSPATNEIRIMTYSPTLDQYQTDDDSQFTLSYDMSGSYQQIGEVSGVASGANSAVSWPGLKSLTEYEWYVSANDGFGSIASPIWTFTTTPSCLEGDYDGDNDLDGVDLAARIAGLTLTPINIIAQYFGQVGCP